MLLERGGQGGEGERCYLRGAAKAAKGSDVTQNIDVQKAKVGMHGVHILNKTFSFREFCSVDFLFDFVQSRLFLLAAIFTSTFSGYLLQIF